MHVTQQVKLQFQETIDKYVVLLQAQSDALENDYQKQIYSVEYGIVWARVIKTAFLGAGTSVHTFVKIATGDIYFTSSWKQPSKRVVGNINNENPLTGTNLHGGNYAR